VKNSKFNKNILIILVFAVLFSAKPFATAQAIDLPPCIVLKPAVQITAPAKQVNKNLNILSGVSHLLTFDEKIISYKFDKENGFKSEILSNIFNNRKELLIKPLKNQENKLTVLTASRIYNFNIDFDKNKQINTKFKPSQELTVRELPEGRTGVELLKNISAEEALSLLDDELDKPPGLPENTCGMADFDLDSPPKIKKIK